MNKWLGIILAVLVGIAAGTCFLLSVNTIVRESIQPFGAELRSINTSLTELKMLSSSAGGSQVLDRLTIIEKRLAAMETKMVAPPAPAAAAARPQPPSEDFNKVYDIDISKSYIKGKKDAPVTVVAFTDFQCPFCARFHTPFQEAVKAFPDKVNFVIKNFPLPFHAEAKPAAKAALAAGEQGKYHEMADLILENQQTLNAESYKDFAKKAGLNVNRFLKDLKDNDAKYEEIINQDLQLVGAVDVRGTPTFFINGKKTMARDFASIKTEIEKILAEKGVK